MKFLIDAQLPRALADWLLRTGHEAVHVQDLVLEAASDAKVLAAAIDRAAVLVTKDGDFAGDLTTDEHSVRIVWVRTGNVSNRVLLERFAASWPEIETHLASGANLVEVR
jgi:predicted nuclease of predicted toxin-antitoxin system